MADDIRPSESVWVVHPDNLEAPQLISDTALDRFLADGFVEMADRARVRDADQIKIFGPPDPPAGAAKAPAPAGGKTTGASGAGEG